jgi:hypothetical protein
MSLILQDKMNWHTFEASFRPEGYNRRIEGESGLEWLERVSIKDSDTLDKLKFRKRNKMWLDESFHFTFSVLLFLREKSLNKEQLEDLVGFDIDLSGQKDWLMSEQCAIKKLMIEY